MPRGEDVDTREWERFAWVRDQALEHGQALHDQAPNEELEQEDETLRAWHEEHRRGLVCAAACSVDDGNQKPTTRRRHQNENAELEAEVLPSTWLQL
jgi:hypothetical protein